MGKSTHFIGQPMYNQALKLASLVGIVLMYYVDFYSLFNDPEKDWENMKILDKNPPPQPTLFV